MRRSQPIGIGVKIFVVLLFVFLTGKLISGGFKPTVTKPTTLTPKAKIKPIPKLKPESKCDLEPEIKEETTKKNLIIEKSITNLGNFVSKINKFIDSIPTKLEPVPKSTPEPEPPLVATETPVKTESFLSLYQVMSDRLNNSNNLASKLKAIKWFNEKIKEMPEMANDSKVTKLLIKSLADKNAFVVKAIEELLIELSLHENQLLTEELVVALGDWDSTKLAMKTANIIIKIGEPAIPTLINALETNNKETIRRVGFCLKKIGPVAIDQVEESYQNGSPATSLAAYEILSEIKNDP